VVTAIIGCMAAVPAGAQAGVGASSTPTFPSTVTVGQTVVPGTTGPSIELENRNTPNNAGDTNVVCNFGDGAPCPPGDPGITMIPACGQLAAFSTCAPSGADPGVFRLPPTAQGDAGTACAGMSFTITLIDPVFGQLRFTPQPAGTNVSLPGRGSICRISFPVDAVAVPAVDQDPATPGNQTVQIVDNTQRLGGLTASARGTSFPAITVQRATPAIATTASPGITVGAGQLADTAIVSGRVNPQAGGTIDFRLYGPGDATCGGPPVFESLSIPYPAAGGPVTSAPYTPASAGTYRWIASYSGDASNAPVAGACNDANETVTVGGAPGTPPTASAVPTSAAAPCTPRPGPAPSGGQLCSPGVARISGPTGCQGSPFRVEVSGSQITQVVFTLDGKRVKALRRPNRGSRYSLSVNPRTMRRGTHRVIATTTFRTASGTRPRTQRIVFQRCSRGAVKPSFTG